MIFFLGRVVICLLLAIPAMYFVAWIDPIREAVCLRTYVVSAVSVYISTLILIKG